MTTFSRQEFAIAELLASLPEEEAEALPAFMGKMLGDLRKGSMTVEEAVEALPAFMAKTLKYMLEDGMTVEEAAEQVGLDKAAE